VYLIGFNNGAMMDNDKALKAEFKYLDIIIVLFVLLLVLSNMPLLLRSLIGALAWDLFS